MNTPQNPVAWFGIRAADLDRAKRFYETVFAFTLQQAGAAEGANRFFIFPANWQSHGTSGMLWHDPADTATGHGGTTVFFECADCEATAQAAVAAGGKLLQGKYPIANGYAAFIEDTEGNRIGLHSRA